MLLAGSWHAISQAGSKYLIQRGRGKAPNTQMDGFVQVLELQKTDIESMTWQQRTDRSRWTQWSQVGLSEDDPIQKTITNRRSGLSEWNSKRFLHLNINNVCLFLSAFYLSFLTPSFPSSLPAFLEKNCVVRGFLKMCHLCVFKDTIQKILQVLTEPLRLPEVEWRQMSPVWKTWQCVGLGW